MSRRQPPPPPPEIPTIQAPPDGTQAGAPGTAPGTAPGAAPGTAPVAPGGPAPGAGTGTGSGPSAGTGATLGAPRYSLRPSRQDDDGTRSPGRFRRSFAPSKLLPTIEYNPFAHRNVPKPTSDFGSLAHLLKVSLGTGILAMPMAFKHAGLILGGVGTIILGLICTHCVQMLVRSSQVLCKRIEVPALTFAKTAEVAFETGPPWGKKMAKTARVIITTELLLSFILGNSIYVVFISQSLYQVLEHFYHPGIDIRLYVLMLWIPLILMCLIRSLRNLVPFSIIANVLLAVSFSLTLYYIFRKVKGTETVYLVAPWHRWPVFLTTIIFAIEGIGTVMPIENQMKHPEHMLGGKCGMLYIAMTIVILVYGIIGFFGYLQYGELTQGSITLNLPLNDPLAQIVKVLVALAIFFTYALQFYVPINIIVDMCKAVAKESLHKLCDVCVRIGLVTFTIILAIVVPNLEPAITLVGAISFSMLGLLLPATIDILVRHPNFGIIKWRLIKNWFIILLSIVALMSGTYDGAKSIYRVYFKQDENCANETTT